MDRGACEAEGKSEKPPPGTHVPDGEEDERGAQHQREHVAESGESEGHGRRPGGALPGPSARGGALGGRAPSGPARAPSGGRTGAASHTPAEARGREARGSGRGRDPTGSSGPGRQAARADSERRFARRWREPSPNRRHQMRRELLRIGANRRTPPDKHGEGVLGLRRGPARSSRLPESRGEPRAFCSLSRSREASARLRTLPRHRRAGGQRPAGRPGAPRAPPKSQSRQRLLPRTGLQVAGKSRVPSDLRPGRGFQGCCAPRGAPGSGPPASATQVPRN